MYLPRPSLVIALTGVSHPGHQLGHSNVSHREHKEAGTSAASSSSHAQCLSVALNTVSKNSKVNNPCKMPKNVSKSAGTLLWLSHHSVPSCRKQTLSALPSGHLEPTIQALLQWPEGWVRTDSVPRSASNTGEVTRVTLVIAEGPAASLPTAGRCHRSASESQLCHRTPAADVRRPILGDRWAGSHPCFPWAGRMGQGPQAEHPASLQAFTNLPWARVPHGSVQKAPPRGPGRCHTKMPPQGGAADNSR